MAEIGKRLGRKALAEVARVAKPDTILEWPRSSMDPNTGAILVGRPSSRNWKHLIVHGMGNKEIANRLDIAEDTVKSHV